MFSVAPLATVPAWVNVTVFVETLDIYARTVDVAAAVELVGENVQTEDDVTPVSVAESVVAVVKVTVPRRDATFPGMVGWHPVFVAAFAAVQTLDRPVLFSFTSA